MVNWAEAYGFTLTFIHPGEPSQNAYTERFNRTYREVVLDAYMFHTVADVQATTQDWFEEYNAIRLHEASGHIPPYQYDLIQL